MARLSFRLLAWFLAMSGFVIQMYNISYIYFQYETVNQIFINQSAHIPPPAIVICSQWYFLRSPSKIYTPLSIIQGVIEKLGEWFSIITIKDGEFTKIQLGKWSKYIEITSNPLENYIAKDIFLKDHSNICFMMSVLPNITVETRSYGYIDSTSTYLAIKFAAKLLSTRQDW